MDWNPHAPDVLGPEWAPRSGATLRDYRIDAPVRAAAMRVDSTVTETVSTLGVFANADTAAGRILAEVLTAGLEVQTDVQTSTFVPNGGSANNATAMPANSQGIADIVAVLDDPVVDLTRWVDNGFVDGEQLSLQLEFNTAGQLTGRRILAVRLYAQASINNAAAVKPDAEMGLIVGSTEYDWRTWTQGFAPWFDPTFMSPPIVVATCGEVLSSTGQPWTVAELQSLDTSALRARVYIGDSASGTNVTRVYRVWLEVDHCPENRLSRNIITSGNAGARWHTFTPRKVDGTANLAKVNGSDLTLVVRQPRYGDAKPTQVPADLLFSVPYVEGFGATPPPGLFEYERVALEGDGRVSVLDNPSTDRVIGLDMQVAGTQSVDAQPYVAVPEITVTGTVQQEVSQASAQAYDGVTFPAKYVDVAGVVGNLVVELRRRSDSALLATATVTQALADTFDPDDVNGWRPIVAPFAASVVLAAATQYYLTFAESGTGSWVVPSLSAVPVLGSAAQGVGSYRGTTDVATYGGGDVNGADISAFVYALPDTPTGLTATADAQPASMTGPIVAPTSIPTILLEWTPPAVSNFAHYEIQRRDEFDTDWQTIKLITSSATDEFEDVEPIRGFESDYRIRTVNVMDIASPWSSEATATPVKGGPGYTFTSNHAPAMSVAYADITGDPVRDYRFPEADEDSSREFYGRNNVVVFRTRERRGTRFDRSVLLSAQTTPARPGPDVFDPLRDLAKADLPYVCVRDEDGNRWYASISVPEGTITGPDGDYQASVRVTQVADDPTAA